MFGPQSGSVAHFATHEVTPPPVSAQSSPARQDAGVLQANRQVEDPPVGAAQLVPGGQAGALGSPPQGSEQYPPKAAVLQKAGLCPQSASTAQVSPTREGPQSPVLASQLAEGQSESCAHLGRHKPPLALAKQRCSLRQFALDAHDFKQSLSVALVATQVAPAGQEPEVAQSRVQ
jgi:hypothetical protein